RSPTGSRTSATRTCASGLLRRAPKRPLRSVRKRLGARPRRASTPAAGARSSGGERMILAPSAEPHDLRLLVATDGGIVAAAKDGTRKLLVADSQDAAYSPDGTLVAFARGGDLWLANADGSGQRRLVQTPNVVEWGPSWLPSGRALVYTASIDGRRQIRLVRLPLGPTQRIAPSNGEEYGATVSSAGRLAFVSTRN